MLIILGLALIAAGLLLAYIAGRDTNDRRDWQAQQSAAQYEAAMAPSRRRHPSAR